MGNWEGHVIERLYEAAVIPELWPDVCERVAASIDAFSTSIITVSPEASVRWVSSPCIAEQMARYGQSTLPARNVRPARALEAAPGAFMREIDLLNQAELAVDPMRLELLEPIGLAWEMGCVIAEPSGNMLITSILNRTANGPFSSEVVARMDALKPDLARASFVAARLAFGHARTITQTLSAVGLPAAVIGLSGKVISMNEGMNGLAPRLKTGARDQLLVDDPSAGELLRVSLLTLAKSQAPLVQSIPLASDGDAPVLVLQLVPVRRDARDIFGPTTAILIATPVGQAGPPNLRVICGLFDLTPVEGRVAQRIAGGDAVDGTARALGIKRETVRSHLKAIFRKTGVNRQSQLTALLSGLRP